MNFHCVCLAVATNSKLDDSPHKIGVTLSEMNPFQAPALYMYDVSNSLRGVFVLLTGGKRTGEWQQTSLCVCF